MEGMEVICFFFLGPANELVYAAEAFKYRMLDIGSCPYNKQVRQLQPDYEGSLLKKLFVFGSLRDMLL